MAITHVVVTVITGTPRQQWCDRCALPSALAVDVLLLLRAGVTRLGTRIRCTSCQEVRSG